MSSGFLGYDWYGGRQGERAWAQAEYGRVTGEITERPTAELTGEMPGEQDSIPTAEFPKLRELVQPEEVLEKMGRGDWDSALRMLRIGAGLREM